MRSRSFRGVAAFVIAASVFSACGELTGPESPSTPTNVVATLASATSATITWTPSPLNDGVISYSIFRNGTKVGESTTTSFTDTGLAQQTTYVYSVAANCKGGIVSDRSVETAQSTVTTVDITRPTVVSTIPVNGATGVSRSGTATVTFSEPMDPTSITTSTFNIRVTSSGQILPGTVTYNTTTRIAEFIPGSPLPNQTNLTVTVTTGVKDLAGNALATNFTASWTTRDEEGPIVTASTPANGAAGVPPGTTITATFNEAVDATTLTAANIALRVTSSGTNVPGAINYNATTRVLTFTPSAPLAQNSGYTFTINGVKDTGGNTMSAPFVLTFTVDTTAPTVTAVSPLAGASGVAIDTVVQVTFSEAMDQSTITSTTITLRNTATSAPVPATVTYDAGTNRATLRPNGPLSNATGYTLTVLSGASGVKDVAGNALVVNVVSSFTTVAVVDNTRPTVVSATPTGSSVPLTTDTVAIKFSESMDPGSLTTTTIRLTEPANPGTNLCTTITYTAATATAVCRFAQPLQSATTYTITVTTGVRDVALNTLASQFIASFITETDTVRPTVNTTSPLDNASAVSRTAAVTITFSEPMKATTITSANIFIAPTAGGANASGTVSYNASLRQAIFTPASGTPLLPSTQYTVTVTSGVQDLAGNTLIGNFTFRFTTGP